MARVYTVFGTVMVDQRRGGYEYFKIWVGNKPVLKELVGKRVIVIVVVPDEEIP